MLTQALRDRRAWTLQTIGEEHSWTTKLPADWLTLAGEGIRQLPNHEGPVTSIPIPSIPSTRETQAVLAALDSGRGFVVLDRVPLNRLSSRDRQAMYWVLGHLFGSPLVQDVSGTLLFDVKDKGYDVTKGARFSGTRAESTFHTDNAFGRTVPDFVGLLCLQPAYRGGSSQLISAVTLHNELLRDHADALETLYEPSIFDRRGKFQEGEPPTS